MPEGKITRQRIKDHLRRLWIAYLAGAVALLFLNNLVYTVTRPGYSDDETLKIMLVNADVSLDEAALLEDVKHLGFKAVEIMPLAAAAENPTSEMLLVTQLIAGFGDIYIADDAALGLLQAREACIELRQPDGGLYLAAAANGTTVESAVAALDILERELGE